MENRFTSDEINHYKDQCKKATDRFLNDKVNPHGSQVYESN